MQHMMFWCYSWIHVSELLHSLPTYLAATTSASPLTSSSFSLSHFQVLKNHLLLFRLPRKHSEFGFDMYEQLPPIRAKRLESVLKLQDSSSDKGDWRQQGVENKKVVSQEQKIRGETVWDGEEIEGEIRARVEDAEKERRCQLIKVCHQDRLRNKSHHRHRTIFCGFFPWRKPSLR